MAPTDSGLHRERAERAEDRAAAARTRCTEARVAAERHDRLVDDADPRRAAFHRRAAALYREAATLSERAAALQAEHADHERRAAEGVPSHTDATRPAAPDTASVLGGLTERYARLTVQQTLVDDRERAADARDGGADDRDRAADERDHAADERDVVATAREDQLDRRDRRLFETGQIHPGIREQREQLARAAAAVDRAHDSIARRQEALDRAARRVADDQASVDREVATSRHREADVSD